MSKIKLFAVAVMILSCIGMNAQNSWNTLHLQWNATNAKSTGGSLDFNGIGAGYSKAFSLSASVPFFIEAGAGLQYMWKKTTDYWGESGKEEKLSTTIDMLSVKIPVNLGYKFQISNGNIAFLPYAGLTVRGNIFAYMRADKEKLNLLDEKATLDAEIPGWRRLQFCWQAGLNVHFNRILLGVSYSKDISKLAEGNSLRLSAASVTVGYCF